MLAPFFRVAMAAPGRQLSFRRLAVGHAVVLALLATLLHTSNTLSTQSLVANILLVMGMVEGAAIIGWRLTQLPKSLALEFILTSPIQPRRLFAAELLVGVSRFLFVQLAGLPALLSLVSANIFEPMDLCVLLGMPIVWGIITGVLLTTWIYESQLVRRVGEGLGLIGVLVYLVVGVLAGEHLRTWLEQLPDTLGRILFHSVLYVHTMNPFGIVRYWFEADRINAVAWGRFCDLHVFALLIFSLATLRAAVRLRGHFHDRHYRPIDSSRGELTHQIGERPLSWWAVRRVMEYSGRVNLWLANGFALVYAAYVVLGDGWPPWLGRVVFHLFEQWGGVPMVSTALVTLAAVPAVYQFGLWDPTVQSRCMRLELLLLTELSGRDYAHASFSAAWRRGRGYFVGALALWCAMAFAGHVTWLDAVAAAVGAIVFWAMAFMIGFRGFASGGSTNGVASIFVLGLPLVVAFMWKSGFTNAASVLPTCLMFVPMKQGITWPWGIGVGVWACVTIGVLRLGLARCETKLRAWYDANQGQKSVE
jgi:hypothetical protein